MSVVPWFDPCAGRWLLNIAVAAMVALGALLLTLGQGGFVLPLVAVAAAAGSVWLTDVTGWFRLSRVAVNAGVIAVGAMIAARSFWLAGIFDASDLAGSLVCLQIVLLFEEKTFRTWWDLVALNLFVVFLAAGLHREIWFGLLLGLYLFLALAAFSLLFLLRGWIEHGDEERGIARGPPARPAIGRPANRGRVAKVALATLLVGPASLFCATGRLRRAGTPELQSCGQPAADARLPRRGGTVRRRSAA